MFVAAFAAAAVLRPGSAAVAETPPPAPARRDRGDGAADDRRAVAVERRGLPALHLPKARSTLAKKAGAEARRARGPTRRRRRRHAQPRARSRAHAASPRRYTPPVATRAAP